VRKPHSAQITGKQPAPRQPSAPDGGTAGPPPGVHEPHPWVGFWFAAADPVGLHRVRLGAGLLFLLWLLPLAGSVEALYGFGGWFDATAYSDTVRLPPESAPVPPIGWSLLYLVGDSPGALIAFYWLSVAVIALFTVGVYPRVTAVLTWLAVASFMANPVTLYDGDVLLAILALYLMAGYVLMGQHGPGRPPAWRLLGPARVWPLDRGLSDADGGREPSVGANVALRLIQVHFALVMVTSALHKLQFGDWWSGMAPWYALFPPSEETVAAVRAVRPFGQALALALSMATYAALAWQLGFPAFAWRRGLWRLLLLGGGFVGWLACSFLYGLPLFGPATMLFCVSYLTPREWRRFDCFVAGLAGRFARHKEAPRPAGAGQAAPVAAGRQP